MGYDPKYGKVTTEKGEIPADEPVFMLRARDVTALDVIGYYMMRSVKAGSPRHHLDMVLNAIDEFRDWRADHPDLIKVPESRRHGGMADA